MGKVGLCKARIGSATNVVPQNFGRVTSIALDPIEKKPLLYYKPGTTVLSIGSYGCNMRCPFCQNDTISTAGANDVAWRDLGIEELVCMVQDQARTRRCIGVAYTYNEPLVSWEYVRDAGAAVHDAGFDNVIVSNGCASESVIRELVPVLDAANIDLKCFSNEGYEYLGGDFATVKNTIEALAESGTCHVEVTTLVVPGFNDDAREVEAAARWIASLSPDIPYHLTRFFPHYKMLDRRPTSRAKLTECYEAARKHLNHVNLGNC